MLLFLCRFTDLKMRIHGVSHTHAQAMLKLCALLQMPRATISFQMLKTGLLAGAWFVLDMCFRVHGHPVNVETSSNRMFLFILTGQFCQVVTFNSDSVKAWDNNPCGFVFQGANASALEKEIGPEQFPVNEHYFGLVNVSDLSSCITE